MAYRTRAFREFHDELTRMSRAYWYFDCAAYVSAGHVSSFAGLISDQRPMPEAIGLPSNQLDATPSEFLAIRDVAMEDLRQMLLVKAFALAEEYLHTAARYWARLQGFGGDKHNKLSEAGDALIKPALVSNVYNSASYLSKAMAFEIDDIAQTLQKGYILRCAVAHNGGFADSKMKAKLPGLIIAADGRISLPWETLNGYLKAIGQICERCECALPERDRRRVETWWIAQDVLDAKPTLNANGLLHSMKTGYDIRNPPSKRDLAKKFGLLYT